MTPKQKNDAYNRDLDAHFQKWKKANPHTDPTRYTFAGYDAWDAGYRAATRSAGKRRS